MIFSSYMRRFLEMFVVEAVKGGAKIISRPVLSKENIGMNAKYFEVILLIILKLYQFFIL